MRNEFTDCIYYNNEIYYFIDETGIPVKCNEDNHKVELLTTIDGLRTIGRGTYFFTAKYRDFLVGLNQSAESVVMVDINTGLAAIYKLDDSSYKWGNIAAAFLYDNLLLCFLKRESVVLIFNLDTKEVKKDRYSNMNDLVFNGGIILGNQAYITSSDDCIVTQYSLVGGEQEDIKTEVKFDKIVDIKMIGNDLLVLESNGHLVRINRDGKIKKEYLIENITGAVNRFCLTNNEEKAVILPGTGSDIYILNINTGMADKYDAYPDDFEYRESKLRSKYGGYDVSELHFFYANRSANYSLSINRFSGEIEWHKQLDIPCEIEMSYDLAISNYLSETENKSLGIFLHMIGANVH